MIWVFRVVVCGFKFWDWVFGLLQNLSSLGPLGSTFAMGQTLSLIGSQTQLPQTKHPLSYPGCEAVGRQY